MYNIFFLVKVLYIISNFKCFGKSGKSLCQIVLYKFGSSVTCAGVDCKKQLFFNCVVYSDHCFCMWMMFIIYTP